ncbi:MAG: heme-degrading domain-containing protein [Chloroflexota bacterium]
MSTYDDILIELEREEQDIQFTSFTNEVALQVGMSLVEAAQRDGKAVTVDIARGGQQLFHYALPGTSPDNDDWIRRKNRVVMRFGHSSYYMGITYKKQQTTIDQKSLLDPRKFAAHGGAFPIIIRGVGVVGTVTVSGLPQEEDHRLVVSVLRELCTSPQGE